MNFLSSRILLTSCPIGSFIHETNTECPPGGVPGTRYAKVNHSPETGSLSFRELIMGKKKYFSQL